MAFKPLRKVEGQDLKRIVLANAVGSSTLTVAVGDPIYLGATTHNKFATNPTTSSKILGVVTALIRAGTICERSSVTGVNAAGTAANTGTDNETTSLWSVEYIPSYIPMEYEADIDAVVGTTTDDNGVGAYFTITSGTPGTVLNASALISTTAFTSATQLTSFGYAPYGTKKIFCRISPSFIM